MKDEFCFDDLDSYARRIRKGEIWLVETEDGSFPWIIHRLWIGPLAHPDIVNQVVATAQVSQ